MGRGRVLGTFVVLPIVVAAVVGATLVDELVKLNSLREAGAVTQDEFDQIKADLKIKHLGGCVSEAVVNHADLIAESVEEAMETREAELLDAVARIVAEAPSSDRGTPLPTTKGTEAMLPPPLRRRTTSSSTAPPMLWLKGADGKISFGPDKDVDLQRAEGGGGLTTSGDFTAAGAVRADSLVVGGVDVAAELEALRNETTAYASDVGRVLQVRGSKLMGIPDMHWKKPEWTGTGNRVTITPHAKQSRVWILVTLNMGFFLAGGGSAGGAIRITRDDHDDEGAKKVWGEDYNLYSEGAGNPNQQYRTVTTLQHLDAPMTTSSITYEVEINGKNPESTGHGTTANWAGQYASITILELQGPTPALARTSKRHAVRGCDELKALGVTEDGHYYVDGAGTHDPVLMYCDLNLVAASCYDLKENHGAILDGTYQITAGGTLDPPIFVYCDMTRDDGGWTLVARVIGTQKNHDASNDAFGILWSPEQRHVARLKNDVLKAIKSQGLVRFFCGPEGTGRVYTDYWDSYQNKPPADRKYKYNYDDSFSTCPSSASDHTAVVAMCGRCHGGIAHDHAASFGCIGCLGCANNAIHLGSGWSGQCHHGWGQDGTLWVL